MANQIHKTQNKGIKELSIYQDYEPAISAKMTRITDF